jgi:hypothetical protein
MSMKSTSVKDVAAAEITRGVPRVVPKQSTRFVAELPVIVNVPVTMMLSFSAIVAVVFAPPTTVMLAYRPLPYTVACNDMLANDSDAPLKLRKPPPADIPPLPVKAKVAVLAVKVRFPLVLTSAELENDNVLDPSVNVRTLLFDELRV